MQRSVIIKLSVMMFLEFFIWGAWLPPSFGFFGGGALGFNDWQQFGLNIAFPVSAIIGMFFANQFVDRNFSAERFLAFSHFVGGLAMLGFGGLAWQAFQGENPQVQNYWLYFACMAVHCFFFVPTISVTNSIAFANITDAQKDFGPIRLWGTIGWIAAAWPFIFILVDWEKVPAMAEAGGIVNWMGAAFDNPLGKEPQSILDALKSLENQDPEFLASEKARMLAADPLYQASVRSLNQGKSWAFLTAGIASLLFAAFSLTLPHTPPRPAKDGESSLAWVEAMAYLKYPYILVLFVVTFIDAAVHDGFFFFAFDYLKHVGVPANWVQAAMSVGQIAEIGTMAFLGLVLKNLGWRYTMILGILGHTVRFAVFAFFPNPYAAVAVNVLHGICYAFFFATLYILVDEVFPKDARTSAQGLFNFLILGLGPIAARYLWPAIQAANSKPGSVNYPVVLLYPSGAALIAAVILLLFFHPPKVKVDPDSAPEEASY